MDRSPTQAYLIGQIHRRMMLGLSEALCTLVKRKFTRARSSQDVVFSETQLTILQNVPKPAIQLRYCPALGRKPAKGIDHTRDKPQKRFDPFANPSPELLIAAVPTWTPTHNLVLNKYPVIHNHFILATKEDKSQTDLLEQDDLYLTYACIKAWKQETDPEDQSLFAFFNSGEHSGASQPHRHIQFLPIEDMLGDQEDNWSLLCETAKTPTHSELPLLHNPTLPFAHFATHLEQGVTAEALHQKYLLLMKAALASISNDGNLDTLEAVSISKDGTATFSYNLALTKDLMAILPRKSESCSIPGLPGSSVAVNGTILAGTMMVKAEDEWNNLRQQPELVQHLLDEITYGRKTQNSENL